MTKAKKAPEKKKDVLADARLLLEEVESLIEKKKYDDSVRPTLSQALGNAERLVALLEKAS